jgi:hypothetical protein
LFPVSYCFLEKKQKGKKILIGDSLNSVSSWHNREVKDDIENYDSTPEKRRTNGRSTYGKQHPRKGAERRSVNDLAWQNNENKRSKSSTADRTLGEWKHCSFVYLGMIEHKQLNY